jgi:UDP-glucose-4-epimerase GalE
VAHLLVTGGAGYVGSHALRALLRAGHSGAVIDDLRAGRAEFAQGVPLVRADVGDRGALAKTFAEHGPFDGVLHFAASASVADSVAQPLDTYRNNVVATCALIEASLEAGTRALVLSSSAAVYGHPAKQPISEDTPLAPINPYGASKAMDERMLADVEGAHGLRFAALRYFNACGADPEGGLGECHDPETHLIPVALEAAAGLRDALPLFGSDWPTRDGSCVRDYIHVTDLADAHVRAVEALLAGGKSGVWNLGTGSGLTNRELIATDERETGRRVPLREAPRRPDDPAELVADASRYRRLSDPDTIVATAWRWLRSWRGV